MKINQGTKFGTLKKPMFILFNTIIIIIIIIIIYLMGIWAVFEIIASLK